MPKKKSILKVKILTEKYSNSAELIGYKCGKGHNAFLNDCKLHKTKNDKRVF